MRKERNLMDTMMPIITIVFGVLIVLITYWANIGNFSKIFLPIKLSHKSPYYNSAKGELNRLAIQMSRIRSGNGTRNLFDVLADYHFKVDGKLYEGQSNLGATNLNLINGALEECQRYFPDQIVQLTTEINKKTAMDFPIGEYNLYLKGMSFDFHPTQKTTPVDVFYEILNPANNCLSIDASASIIVIYILGILLWSSIGAFFATRVIPGENFALKFILGLLLLATACIPAFFSKSKLPQAQVQQEKESTGKATLDIVIDQNNSEQYIKDQILKQKEKLGLIK